jgi:hypothetical protein
LLLASFWFLAWIVFRPSRWRRHVSPKIVLTFNGLHGIISQKIELFVTTSMRTSDPTQDSVHGRSETELSSEHAASTFKVLVLRVPLPTIILITVVIITVMGLSLRACSMHGSVV